MRKECNITIIILSLLIFVGSGCVISPFAYNEFTPTYAPPKRRNEFSIVYSRFEWILPKDGGIRIPWEYQIPWYLHPKNSIGGFIKVGLEPKERVEVGIHFGLSISDGSPYLHELVEFWSCFFMLIDHRISFMRFRISFYPLVFAYSSYYSPQLSLSGPVGWQLSILMGDSKIKRVTKWGGVKVFFLGYKYYTLSPFVSVEHRFNDRFALRAEYSLLLPLYEPINEAGYVHFITLGVPYAF